MHYFLESYMLYFLCLFNLGRISKKNNDKLSFIFIFILFFILSALRANNIGNDTHEYIRIFNEVSFNGLDGITQTRYEIGYMLLNYVVSLFTHNTQYIILITSLIIYYGYYKFLKKYSCDIWLSIFLFYNLGFFSFSLSGIRQNIAMVIIFLAYYYLDENKKIRYIITVLIASLFHTSAILFFITYPLKSLKFNIKSITSIMLITLGVYVGFDIFLDISYIIFSQYQGYSLSIYGQGEIRLASILNTLVILSFFILSLIRIRGIQYNRSIIQKEKKQLILLLYIIQIAMCFSFISLKFNIIDRVVKYFSVFLLVLIPNILTQYIKKNKLERQIITLILVICSLIYNTIVLVFRPEWNIIFPYRIFLE